MKSKILFCTLLIIYTAINVKAQKPVYPKPNSGDQVPFGKKMPPPVLNPWDEITKSAYGSKKMDLPYTTFDTVSKQFIVHAPGQKTAQYPASGSYKTTNTWQNANKPVNTSLGIHLTKDINTTGGGSYPSNNPPENNT